MMVIADDIDQTIQPFEYATVIFKMFGDFLLTNYKRFDKNTLDELLPNLNRQYIESFTYPASLGGKQYSLGDIE